MRTEAWLMTRWHSRECRYIFPLWGLTNFQRSFIFWFFPSKRPRLSGLAGCRHYFINRISNVLDLFRLFLIEHHFQLISLILESTWISLNTIINRHNFLLLITFLLRFDRNCETFVTRFWECNTDCKIKIHR